LVDNLNHASKGNRTPPDWWHDLRRSEEIKRGKVAREKRNTKRGRTTSVPEKAIASLDEIQETIFDTLLATGQTTDQASENSKQFLKALMRKSHK
jgi:hypothetical protein